MDKLIRRLKSNIGLTLIEVIVGMAVTSVIMVGVVGLLGASVHAYRYNMAQGTGIQEARTALNKIADELRYADSITRTSSSVLTYKKNGTSTNYTIQASGNAVAFSDTSLSSYGTSIQSIVFEEVPSKVSNQVLVTVKALNNQYSGDAKTVQVQMVVTALNMSH